MSTNQIRITMILIIFTLTSLFGWALSVDLASVFSVAALIIAVDAWVLSNLIGAIVTGKIPKKGE